MVDIAKYRDDFPVLKTQMNGKPLAFLDTAASAQKPVQVIGAMNTVQREGYSNIHRGAYKLSQDLTFAYEAVRTKVANFIGAGSDKEIIFTRNTTGAINLVAHSWGRAHLKDGDEIILTAMEHHANIVPWQLLQREIDFTIKTIPFDERGVLDLNAFEKLLSNKTKFIGVVHVSNALGTINPVVDMIKTARAFNSDIKILIDGSQAVVHGAVNVQDIDADFYCFTGHKLYGPTGIGVLYGKYEVLETMQPYEGGGDMIERVSFDGTTYKEPPFLFEAGTPAIVEGIGLGAAIDYVTKIGMENIAAHEAALMAYATAQLDEIGGLHIYGQAPDKAGVISFTMDGAHPSDIAMILDQCGVAVRTGHHCCMPAMTHMGLEATARASLGLYSNKDDVDQLAQGLRKVKTLMSC